MAVVAFMCQNGYAKAVPKNQITYIPIAATIETCFFQSIDSILSCYEDTNNRGCIYEVSSYRNYKVRINSKDLEDYLDQDTIAVEVYKTHMLTYNDYSFYSYNDRSFLICNPLNQIVAPTSLQRKPIEYDVSFPKNNEIFYFEYYPKSKILKFRYYMSDHKCIRWDGKNVRYDGMCNPVDLNCVID